MNIARTGLLTSLALLVAVGAAAGAADWSADPNYWALAFENDTPKPIVIDDPSGKLTYYWYMVYRVSNPNSRALPCRLDLSLELVLKKDTWTYADVNDRVAERHVEKKLEQKPLMSCVELRAKPIQPNETREAVAIFRAGSKAHDFDAMTIFVRGLAARRTFGRKGDPATPVKTLERVLNLKYVYVASRWKVGKELKLDEDLWTLKNVDVPARDHTDRASDAAAAKRLEELRKKAEELRKKLPPPGSGEPPPKSSARPPGAVLPPSAAPLSQETARRILSALHLLASSTRRCRASFVETIGAKGEAQQVAKGTLYLGKDGKFSIERVRHAGTPQAIKELRVYDGTTLWAQTTTKEFGDNVRRCDRAKTKKQWHSLDGRPEVDFATVANPVQAWRLFGDELIHLGVEHLEGEAAYVFEARPAAAFEPILTGPLSSEVLYKAGGRRVRFWIGSKSGFQLRMRVYGDNGSVLASLECDKVDRNAHVADNVFAFAAPKGVKVTDVNTAIVDSHPPTPPKN